MRPMFSTRNDAVQITHHLAAVTNPEREGIAAFKETGKFIARPRIEQDGLGPAFAGAQYVAIGKTTTGGKSCEIFKADEAARSEERRVGKECGRTCGARRARKL